MHGSRHHRADPPLNGTAVGPAQDAALLGYDQFDFDVATWDTCDSYGRFRIRLDEMVQSLRIIDQVVDRLDDLGPGSVMVEDRKIAWPAQLNIGSDGQGNSREHIDHIMNESMEALIHHFKLVTEGFAVPAGQVYTPVESPRGELGVHGERRRHTSVPRALPRPVLHQPAGRRCDV